MKDRLAELGTKYGDYTKVPLKSFEVAPGVSRSALEPRVPISKLIDKSSMYIGRDGKYYPSTEALQAANDLWKQQNYTDIKRKPF